MGAKTPKGHPPQLTQKDLKTDQSDAQQWAEQWVTGFKDTKDSQDSKRSEYRRLGSLEASDDLSVAQECLVGAFLLLLMFMVYLFTRRVAAPKASESNKIRIVRKKAPIMYKLL